ncbi:hypothetical protein FA15DRAFT_250024 [Coprinopsis marcescibilis]|uniref:Peptidase M43 pregnancy-associated plasma-A domain-containing protein n=1 Tax=Coprinopsis marcescibilis TaxID=230819 RepID=A0A5C3L1J1_COPMA|nr:hypothetical protein FA15DRAFT_250024 [Coprinopsis marcescibilis]
MYHLKWPKLSAATLVLVLYWQAVLGSVLSPYKNPWTGSRRRNVNLDEEGWQEAPCGTNTTYRDSGLQQLVASLNSSHNRRRQFIPQQTYTFNVVWQVIASNFTYEGGWLPDLYIQAQMEQLNRNYEGTGISWVHTDTVRTISPYWHESIDSSSGTFGLRSAMYHTLKRGGATTMNVYTLGFTKTGINGYSTMPDRFLIAPTLDAVGIRFTTLPLGNTVTHESGHWLGLQHPFDRGCDPGDGVYDTPAQSREIFGCPIGENIDSCPDQPGLDPIHNFMEYTDDSCRTHFTPGQVEFMHTAIQTYRMNAVGEARN